MALTQPTGHKGEIQNENLAEEMIGIYIREHSPKMVPDKSLSTERHPSP